MYKVERKIPKVEDYTRIRKETGLSYKAEEHSIKGLNASVFSVIILHEDETVGMGRLIGDGGCFYQVVDIAVLPEHQKKGLGAMIMEEIMDYIKTNVPETSYISLIAEPEVPPFYEKYGFKLCSPNGEGMFLRV